MEIPEIKQRLAIDQVLAHYHLAADRNHRLHCPFHPDKTPSLQVYSKTNTVFCFSSNCPLHGKALDVIDFVLHKEGCTKHEAIEKCKQLIGILPQHLSPAPGQPAMQPTTYDALLRQFRANLKKSPQALAYLQKRVLAPAMGIGYNAVGWPHLKHCIIFDLRDKDGRIASFYGRSIYDKAGSKHYYLPDRAGLYPWYPYSHKPKLILTESVIDTASLLQIDSIASHYNLLALYGTNGLVDEHLEAITSLSGLEEIILLLNGDDPGRAATTKHAATLQAGRPDVTVSSVSLPEGEDVNSLLQTHPDTFTTLIGDLIDGRKIFLSSDKKEQQHPAASLTIPAPMPAPAAVTAPANDTAQLDSTNPYKLRYTTPTASYYVQGGVSKVLDSLRVTLVIEHPQRPYKARNKLDLYEDKQVEKISREVSEKLQLRSDLVQTDLYRLTDLLDTYREEHLQTTGNEPLTIATALSPAERERLTAFGRRPDLLTAINTLLGQSGIVGETNNRLFMFLVALSHRSDDPLHVLIQGSSGSGKTRLLQQISDCMPPESVERFTRLSDKALYNYPENYLRGKLLCLEDVDGLSEEAEFAWRELVSNGELISAVSIKDEAGRIMSGKKIVRGPVASMACTTHGRVYEDNISRMLLVAVDERPEQTARIIAYQNGRAAGKTDPGVEKQHKQFLQQFVRQLQPAVVINPYADKILLPEGIHKLRRLNDLFQVFVRLITLVHQQQRPRDKRGRLVSTRDDVRAAVRILFDSIVLKVDELDGSLRQFYERLKAHVKKVAGPQHEGYWFSQRDVRQAFHMSKSQLHRYVQELVGLEYLQEQGFRNRGFTYRIGYWDDYKALREKIKAHLASQLEPLYSPGTGHPGDASGTPESA
jgi:DNA primase